MILKRFARTVCDFLFLYDYFDFSFFVRQPALK